LTVSRLRPLVDFCPNHMEKGDEVYFPENSGRSVPVD
jgi:hypothetical protein